MPPQSLEQLSQKVHELEFLVKNHQHDGLSSQKLRNQYFNLIARTSLGVAGTSVTLDGIPAKRFLRVLIEHSAKSGNGNNYLRFNNDSGNNYTFIENGNGTARVSQGQFDLID